MIFGPNYSGGPIVSSNLPAYNVQICLNALRDAFLAANWTLVSTISGSGSTTGYELKSYPTPLALVQMRVSVWWDGTTTVLFGWPIIQLKVADGDGNSTFTANFLTIRSDVGNKTVRFVCNQHQFMCWYDSTLSPGGSSYTTNSFNNNTAFGGVPVLADTTLGQQAYWFQYSGEDLRQNIVPSNLTYYAWLHGGVFNSGQNNVSTLIAPCFMCERGSDLQQTTPFWNGNFAVMTPVLLIGTTTTPIALSIWDAIIVCGSYTGRITTFADFCNWENVTDGGQVGTLFHVTGKQIASTIPGYSY
jgi:hypothetical protein